MMNRGLFWEELMTRPDVAGERVEHSEEILPCDFTSLLCRVIIEM